MRKELSSHLKEKPEEILATSLSERSQSEKATNSQLHTILKKRKKKIIEVVDSVISRGREGEEGNSQSTGDF